MMNMWMGQSNMLTTVTRLTGAAGMFMVVFFAAPETVQAGAVPLPEQCAGRQPPALTRALTCTAHDTACFELEEVLNKKFPGSTNSIEFRQDKNTYVALRFSTENISAVSGRWIFEIAQGFSVGGIGPKLMTLSTCPGDFDRQAIVKEMGENCFVRAVGLDMLTWKFEGVQDHRRCELKRDKTYYLNILYTSQPVYTPLSQLSWDCNNNQGATTCGNLMAASYSRNQ